ncbi:MAG: hypothetical protein K6E60_07900 [Saccharofermentans sp.]|nr:hypothetical protein [Clostridiales bacterium]MCR5341256.1 hypothetical protein [Saccharofermentans sp.]
MSRTSDRKISDIMSDFLGASWRATVRLFKSIPSRIFGRIRKVWRDYRDRPPRKDISRVYLVVGYTTKKYVEERYNAERRMMIMRRGLLALIFFLLLFIVLDRSLSAFNYGEIKQMFGFSSWTELLKNDPFSERKETAPTAPVQPTAVSTTAENKTET